MRLLAVLATSFATMLPLSAHADIWSTFGAVQCGDDEVAIRFGGQMNSDPPYLYVLPDTVAGAWSTSPVDRDARCELANGSVVVVVFDQASSASEQGPGKVDPTAWVDIWIDGKHVLTREVYKTAGAFKAPWLNSIIVAPDTITRCGYFEYPAALESSRPTVSVKCESSGLDLNAIPADQGAPHGGQIPGIQVQRRDPACDNDQCRADAEWRVIGRIELN